MCSKTAVIRTSDRITFKRCRRRWALSSSLVHNRSSIEISSYFWVGIGGHFALQDFHGHRNYEHPSEAFRAFRVAYQNTDGLKLPDDWKQQEELCTGVLDYYLTWLKDRQEYDTYYVDGEPQVEVRCQLELPISKDILELSKYDKVVYDFTFDRVVEIDDELWIIDYKFYKLLSTSDFDFDSQIEAYIWASQTIYERPVAGLIFQQHLKSIPSAPRILVSGKISVDKKQKTTYRLYKEALIKRYDSVDIAPSSNIECLNSLYETESEDYDKFVRRDRVRKIPEQIANTGKKVMLEVEEMINPNLPCYPNLTKDCSWDCTFVDICIMMDCDSDWKTTLDYTTYISSEERDLWKKNLTVFQ